MFQNGPFLAISAAALFGVSPTFVKFLMGSMSPILLAGLLYLGAALGLQLVLFVRRQKTLVELKKLTPRMKWRLASSVICGGIFAPLCLTYGIQAGTAFEVSLLLNLETVATTLLAWLVFHESIGPRVWLGKFFLVVGAALITLHPQSANAAQAGFVFSKSALFILGACVFWGIDNNLTRDLEDLPPIILASVRGWVAGSFNIFLALLLSQTSLSFVQAAGCLTIGAFSYGVSLIFFIGALRAVGSARTSTYFAIAPFFGMMAALVFLGEHPSTVQWISSGLMALGLWSLFGERHSHSHHHEFMRHSHSHTHDEHHQHSHEGTVFEGIAIREPHDHEHTHEPMTHSHVHWPDIHHRHGHGHGH